MRSRKRTYEIVMSDKKIHKSDIYRKYIFDEMTKKIYQDNKKSYKDKKRKIKRLKHYVDSISDRKAKKLCCSISWDVKDRGYGFVSRGPEHWMIETIDISKIFISPINRDIDEYLFRNEWSLERITKDKEICGHKEFEKMGHIHSRSLTLIAERIGDKYYIVDGNHRAIKLACQGQIKFELIFY